MFATSPNIQGHKPCFKERGEMLRLVAETPGKGSPCLFRGFGEDLVVLMDLLQYRAVLLPHRPCQPSDVESEIESE